MKNKGKRNFAIIFGGLMLSIFIVGAFGGETKNKEVDKTSSVDNSQSSKVVEAAGYSIVSEKDRSMKAVGNQSLSSYSYSEIAELPISKRVEYRVVVDSNINSEQILPTVERIVNEKTSENPEIDGITALLYSDESLSSGAYDIARAVWAPKGDLENITAEIARSNNRGSYEISLDIKENLEEYLKQRSKSETKFGLREEVRKEIFHEIVAAEDRAAREAEDRYPTDINTVDAETARRNVEKNASLTRDLTEKYTERVLKKYDISAEVETKITTEAFEEGWAME